MRTKELMLGDWVCITDDDTNTHFNARVEAIDWVGNVYAKAPGDETAYPYSIDCIKPIPITSEILKKNYSSTPEWYFEGTNKYYLRIIAIDEGNLWKFYYGRRAQIQISIQYVHELQHALRLCNIETEIKL